MVAFALITGPDRFFAAVSCLFWQPVELYNPFRLSRSHLVIQQFEMVQYSVYIGFMYVCNYAYLYIGQVTLAKQSHENDQE